MTSYKDHLILSHKSIRDALEQLNNLGADTILFVVDDSTSLLGSLTDGDIRRGFLRGLTFEDRVIEFVEQHPKFIRKGSYKVTDIVSYRENGYKVLPVIDDNGVIVDLINFRNLRSYLPIDAIIMAGGRGERLRPLTDTVPKPLLPINGKPIIQYSIDRLRSFGIAEFWISIRYLSEKIKDHFAENELINSSIHFVEENRPLGTIGSLGLINGLKSKTTLVMNSDILTDINLEDFYVFFESQNADLAVACIPYKVNVPYAVMETHEHIVRSLKEKPTYTYYSNAGIYLMKTELMDFIPRDKFYNATDLMDDLIRRGKTVVSYPLVGYWLDIGKHDDYLKAQEDIKHLSL